MGKEETRTDEGLFGRGTSVETKTYFLESPKERRVCLTWETFGTEPTTTNCNCENIPEKRFGIEPEDDPLLGRPINVRDTLLVDF